MRTRKFRRSIRGDAAAIAGLNQKAEPQLVTVNDDVDLPVIAAFSFVWRQGVQPRHPILLKDEGRRMKERRQRFSFRRCSWRRPTSVRCCAMESGTQFWCKANKRRGRRCD